MSIFSTLRPAANRFRQSWKRLFVVALAHRLLAFILLTPLVAGLFRLFVALYSDEIVADEDLAAFIASPIGWGCVYLVGSLWLGIRALEVGSMTMVLAAPASAGVRSLDAIRMSFSRAPAILPIGFRFLVALTLGLLPICFVALWVYQSLLSEYDINYYLKQWPAEFVVAIGAGVVLAAAAIGYSLYLISKWLFAIPITMLDQSTARTSMHRSEMVSQGSRMDIIAWHAAWLAATAALSSLVTLAIMFTASKLLDLAGESLWGLAVIGGAAFLLASLATTVVELLHSSGLAAIQFQLFTAAVGDDWSSLEDSQDWPSTSGRAPAFLFRLTWPRAAALLVVGVLVSAAIGAASIQTIDAGDHRPIEVHAHRGASLVAPENTLAAIREAVRINADWVEVDVQLTADGKVVVAHDKDLMRLAKRDLKIADTPFDELRRVDIGSWFDKKFRNERIPTLAETLAVCRDEAGLNIELKPDASRPGLAEATVRIVEEEGMLDQVVFMSLDRKAVAEVKRLQPNARVGMLLSISATRPRDIPADFLAVNASFATGGFIGEAHESGKRVLVWTVNDVPAMTAMLSRGADGLITDDPELALSVVSQRKTLTAGERLLAALASYLGAANESVNP